MRFEDRARQILERLDEQRVVGVPELSEYLGVSHVTVRKDLQRMEDAGQLVRTFGGATIGTPDTGEQQRMLTLQRIADRVVEDVQEEDCLILNAGTTTQFIAQNLLRFKQLKVITNSVYIAKELSKREGFQLIFLGGEMNANAVFTYGRDAIAQLEQYKADKLILSASGINCSRGLTTRHMEAADLLQKMVERAKEVIIVADDGKIGFESFYHVSDVGAIAKLVTNRSSRPEVEEELQRLQASGIEVCRC